MSYATTDDIQQDLRTMKSYRGFFAHQSVGNNILDGLAGIMRRNGENVLPILELGDSTPPEGGFLVHTPIGRNEEPVSKCEDFRRIIDQELAGKIDYALLKFCYIDINAESNVADLFAAYRTVMDDLKTRHPHIAFIHVTAPLRDEAKGFEVWAREMLGRPNRSKLANIKRNDFNRLLRETYANDPIFDLAASQSTYPDGSRESFSRDGRTYYSLIGNYTSDGRHLNETGREFVAADFVRSIGGALSQKAEAASL